MVLKKILRFVLIFFFVLTGLLLVFLVVSIAPINRNVDRDAQFADMQQRIDAIPNPEAGQSGFSVGYAKVNLTPPYRTATAGYGKRLGKLFTSVHDSIYVRTLVVDNGIEKVAIVSADLLMIPPTVAAVLEKELPAIGFRLDNTYLGAIHSHNSIGNWGTGAMTILYGSYDDSLVHFIADKIKESILEASAKILPSTVKTGALPLTNIVYNRLIDNGPVDSLLRVIEVTQQDSSKLLLMNFTAHATCLYSKDLELSRDYPGKLVDIMEEHGYRFAMFMAGSVGSHAPKVPEQGWPCVDSMTVAVSRGFNTQRNRLRTITDSTLVMHRVPLVLSDPQVKVLENWRLRPWLFNKALGDYPAYITVLRLGSVVMLGTPCDFSGEFDPMLDALAARHGLTAMVTSFNGGYVGYVTPTKYYDEDHYETQLMNWYGPGNAEYIEHCLEELLLSVTRE